MAVTPFGLPDGRLLAACCRAGVQGVLDLSGHDGPAAAELRRAARWVPGRFGVRVNATLTAADLPEQVDTVVVPAGISAGVWGGRTVLAEVTGLVQARAAITDGADGLLARGAETGDPDAGLSVFVLLQQLLAELGVPVWAWGGIGPHTAAAAVAGGAAGVVLDTALALLPEACPPPAMAAALTRQTSGAGLDAYLAADLARRHRDVPGVIRAIRAAVESGRTAPALGPGAPLARRLGTTLPVVQGPMTRVSDRPELAAAVAAGGGLPCVALSLADGKTSHSLLRATARAVAGQPWAAGILGFAPEETRAAQLDAILEAGPAAVIIAGGRPDQAARLESAGVAAFLHVPSPGLLRQFLGAGARRFVFEGAECGGHIGPASSFALWQAQIPVLLDWLDEHPGDHLDVLFAGGVHDARSAAMATAAAAPLAARGAGVGLLMGTAYLFTAEAVGSGAIGPVFQQEILRARATTVLETAPGHLTRCVASPYAAEFTAARDRLRAAGTPDREIWDALERLNLGRLRLASKGLRRTGGDLEPVDERVQRDGGLFMAGQVAVLRDAVTTVAELHAEVTAGAAAWLAVPPADAVARPEPDRAAAPLDVAIVGLAGIFPGAGDTAAFWSQVVAGADAITEVPADRWDPDRHDVPSRWGGFLPRVPVDPVAWGIPPASLAAIEPVQLLALEAAGRALADAGYQPFPDAADSGRPFDRSRTAVVFGAESGGELAHALTLRAVLPAYLDRVPEALDAQLPGFTEDTFPGVLANVITGRIANRMDLGGANYIVDAACASSLAALDAACRELVTGSADLVLCGGADTHNSLLDYRHFAAAGALSPTGRSRPFDAAADGIALGEGVGCLVLKRLADAERDGDRVYAVISGVGSASDGRARGLTAPRPEGQRAALLRAYRQAGVSPAEVGLVEAHGTGTVVGDRTELATLTGVYTEAGAAPGSAALGSVKSQIGHTKCAAGMAGLIKTALSIHTGIRPPTTHLTRPHDDWSEDSPFAFDKVARPWPDTLERRVGAVSGFGFGGTNFHAVLTGHRGPEPRHGLDQWPVELFLFASPADAAWLRGLLDTHPRARLRDLARTAAARLSRTAAAPTHSVLATSIDDLRSRLENLDHDGVRATERPKLALLFPGQGSQRVDMFASLLITFPELREPAEHGGDWVRALYPGAAFDPDSAHRQRNRLRDTRNAQPALGLTGLAAHRFLTLLGVTADMAGGHSYGELVALTAAGALPATALSALSLRRAEEILAAAGSQPGTMAAVTGPPDEIAAEVAAVDGVVLANHNSPTQTVIAGVPGAVEQATARLRALGHTVTALDVACAFHSPLVTAAGPGFTAAVAGLSPQAPRIPVYANRTARPYPDRPALIAVELGDQIGAPVRFADQIEAMYAAGARVFAECGPGTTLSNLVGAILADRPHRVVNFEQAGGGLAGALSAVAELALAGVPVHLDPLYRGRDATDLTDTVPAPPPRWTVDGHAVRTADGAYLTGGIAAARPVPAAALPGDPDRLIEDYLRTTREFVATQRDVMLAYLGTPPPAAVEPAHAPEPTAAPAVTGAATAPAEPVDTLDRVRAVISTRTGYPVDLIGADVDLEADLSIDSIKRTEIVGELTGGTGPALERLGRARTAGEMAALLDGGPPAVAPQRFLCEWAPAPPAADAVPAGRTVTVDGPDELVRALREQGVPVVADGGDDLVLAGPLGDGDDEQPWLPVLFEELRAAAATGRGVLVAAVDGDARADGLPGFVRSMRQERPGVLTRLVSVPSGVDTATVAALLTAELADRDGEPVVRHGTNRLAPSVRPVPPSRSAGRATTELNRDSVVLLIGGGRGITATVAGEFAARTGCRIVLAGRTAPDGEPEDAELAAATDLTALRRVLAGRDPAGVDRRARAVLARREVAATVAELRALSRTVEYRTLDVTDAEAVHGLVKTVHAAYRRLDGVVFAAGVIEDRLLADKTTDSFRRVFGTKVDGARNVLDALDHLPDAPGFVTLFGSVAAVRGSRGQCDYAAANDALDDCGRRWAARTGRRCLTVHWGPWAPDRRHGGMVTAELAGRYAARGVQLIDPAAGAAALLDELTHGDPALTSVVYAAPGW
ncbi:type I polyketide synthase [Actinoplanes lobatus]|nr:type I polyketide synthase [Actinoplanes lobatus]MBB4753705.1 acyl transferase domain-containing protein/NAD(P)H-dependent flavin oxidoreductase YrpB (nitropropane dioxygenase family) [Actinoplanes lobatus]